MDKTETKETEGKLNPTDAGYKWFACPTCDGTAKISQDQLDQINKDPLRSELQQLKEYKDKLKSKLIFWNAMSTEDEPRYFHKDIIELIDQTDTK